MSPRQPAWSLSSEDFEKVQESASLLYLAAMARNEYFQQIRSYVNRTMCDLYWQRFTEPVDYISVTARRRDGQLMSGGYKHGEVKFTVPPQADSRESVSVDVAFVEALNRAVAGTPDLMRRLKPAVAFLSLANTDSDAMPRSAEVILMGAAFEQLLEANGAYELSKKFGDLFQSFGSVKVEEALKVRIGIRVNRKHVADQRSWFVHRKWIEELHKLRSAHVHGECLSARTWGWQPSEHLVMAAFTFPLAVKLLLSESGHYTLTRSDKASLGALDELLACMGWQESGPAGANVWQERLHKSKSRLRVDDAVRAFERRQVNARAIQNGEKDDA
jgi:hypothetical protein